MPSNESMRKAWELLPAGLEPSLHTPARFAIAEALDEAREEGARSCAGKCRTEREERKFQLYRDILSHCHGKDFQLTDEEVRTGCLREAEEALAYFEANAKETNNGE